MSSGSSWLQKNFNEGDLNHNQFVSHVTMQKIKTALNPGLNEGLQVVKSHVRAKNTHLIR